MALLARLGLAVALSGCYAPELRDCTVTCASASECSADQVCGGDGFCAAPASAGRCLRVEPPDADSDGALDARVIDAAPPVDAAMADAAVPPIDAPVPVTLDVRVDGHGEVVVAGIATCDDDHCMYTVSAGVTLMLEAAPDAGWRFDKWDSATCSQQDETCTTVAEPPKTSVRAKFKRNHGGDD
jgi:hypothetical protein